MIATSTEQVFARVKGVVAKIDFLVRMLFQGLGVESGRYFEHNVTRAYLKSSRGARLKIPEFAGFLRRNRRKRWSAVPRVDAVPTSTELMRHTI